MSRMVRPGAATAHLAFQVLHGGHEEFGIVAASGAGWACPVGARGVGGASGCGGGAAMRPRPLDEADVAAGGGAREQHALQRGGALETTVQVGENGGEVGRAEARRDRVEVGGGGAVADGGDEVAAVGEQGAGGVEQEGDVVGQSDAGVILRGIGRGGD